MTRVVRVRLCGTTFGRVAAAGQRDSQGVQADERSARSGCGGRPALVAFLGRRRGLETVARLTPRAVRPDL